MLSPDIQRAVDRTAATQDTATRPYQLAAINVWVSLRLVAPGQIRAKHRLEITDRDMDPRIPVSATSFEEEDLIFWILRETVRYNAASGASTNDDVVISFAHVRFP